MKISVILATYNRASLIEGALNSLVNQSHSNWECIIIDDGSEDETDEISQKWTNKDPRFRFYKRSKKYKKGLSGARNMGLDLALGEAIIFVDDDDYVHPENFEICLRYLKNPKCFYCRYDKKPFIYSPDQIRPKLDSAEDHKSSKVNKNRISEVIKGELAFASCCVMWRKECFEDNNFRFKEELQYAEEWELYSRIILEGYEGVSIDKVLYFNRKHENSNTGEYHKKNPLRISSKVKASKIILKNLPRELITEDLSEFFIRLGFNLNSWALIRAALFKSGAGSLIIIKYRFGFILYPILRPFFLLKGRINQ